MKRFSKRFISVVLALLMCLSLFSSMAMAEESVQGEGMTFDEAINSIAGTYKGAISEGDEYMVCTFSFSSDKISMKNEGTMKYLDEDVSYTYTVTIDNDGTKTSIEPQYLEESEEFPAFFNIKLSDIEVEKFAEGIAIDFGIEGLFTDFEDGIAQTFNIEEYEFHRTTLGDVIDKVSGTYKAEINDESYDYDITVEISKEKLSCLYTIYLGTTSTQEVIYDETGYRVEHNGTTDEDTVEADKTIDYLLNTAAVKKIVCDSEEDVDKYSELGYPVKLGENLVVRLDEENYFTFADIDKNGIPQTLLVDEYELERVEEEEPTTEPTGLAGFFAKLMNLIVMDKTYENMKLLAIFELITSAVQYLMQLFTA